MSGRIINSRSHVSLSSAGRSEGSGTSSGAGPYMFTGVRMVIVLLILLIVVRSFGNKSVSNLIEYTI